MASEKVLSRKNTFASLTKSAFNPIHNNEYESLQIDTHAITSRRESSGVSTPRNQSPLNQPPSPSNIPKLESDYIYINRKKANDVIMTENLRQHSEYRKSISLNRPHQLWTLDRLPTSIFAKSGAPSPLQKPDKTLHVKDMTSPIARRNGSTLTILGGKEVFDELVLAGDATSQLAKFNPLSPKSPFEKPPKTTRDKSTQIVLTHSHRIYGSHHQNLKKINLMLGTSKTGGHNPTELKERRQETQPPEASDSSPSNRANEFKRHEELGRTLAKGFNVYEYDPLTDEFQFTGPDMNEMEVMLHALTDPETGRSSRRKSMKKGYKIDSSRKSQAQDTPREVEDGQESQRDDRKGRANTTFLPKIRAGSLKIITNLNNLPSGYGPEGITKSGHSNTTKNKKEVCKTEKDQKNIVLKEIEALCSQFSMQNKKMRDKFKFRKDYSKSTRKMSALVETDGQDGVLGAE